LRLRSMNKISNEEVSTKVGKISRNGEAPLLAAQRRR